MSSRPADEEQGQPPTDRALTTWEDEGGRVVGPPTGQSELESTRLSSVLPPEFADRFTKPFGRFLKIEAATGVVLLVATCTALILSNSAWSTPFLSFWEIPVGFRLGSFDFSRSLQH